MNPSYAETVDYLFGLLPMYQRTGALVGKYDLSKTVTLLDALGNPHRGLRIVHVGGTNGKGSVSHAIASLATAAGLKVGLYTSPHYVDYRERIRVDGITVGEEFVVGFVAQHRSLIEALEVSFFEFTVAMAFSYFQHRAVDLAVIEVGLGGRLDSTNVVDPLLSVITNIDLDHTEVLGDTHALIAAEKAGIIKPNRPVVIGRHRPDTWEVFDRTAHQRQAPIYLAEELVTVSANPEQVEIYFEKRENHTSTLGPLLLPTASLSIRGPYVVENVRTALAAYALLRSQSDLPLAPPIGSALQHMEALSGYRGRFVRFRQNETQPLVIADAGHNLAAWQQIVPAVVAEAAHVGSGVVRVVCGFVRGKHPSAFVTLCPRGTRFYCGDLDLPRNKPSAETLAELPPQVLAKGYPTIAEAFRAALKEAAPDETIFVGGSSFVVGAFLAERDLLPGRLL